MVVHTKPDDGFLETRPRQLSSAWYPVIPMDLGKAQQSNVRDGRKYLGALLAGSLIMATKVVLSAPRLAEDPTGVVITWLTVASFIVVSVVLLFTSLPQANAWGCLLIAASAVPGDLNTQYWAERSLSPLGFVLELSYLPAVVALVLRYPTAALTRPHRRAVAILVTASVGLRIPLVFTSGHLADGFYRPANWPTVDASPWWHDQLFLRAGQAISVIALVWVAIVLIRRSVELRGLARQSTIPLTIIGVTCSLAAAVDRAAWLHVYPLLGDLHSAAIRNASAALIPITLLADILRRRTAVAAVAERILVRARSGDLTAIRDSVRFVLVDPEAEVWAPTADGTWVDCHGRADSARDDPSLAGRVVRQVDAEDGQPLLLVGFDPRTVRDTQVIGAVLQALRVGLENVRLHADLLAALHELDESRRRLVETGVRERRRLERDLHDGAQQQLLAVSATLATAQLVDDARVRELLDEARSQLKTVVAELRALARGIHPAALSEGGLAAALPYVAERCAVPTTLHVDSSLATDRPDPGVEQATYFLVAEGLANVSKHSRATSAQVEVGVANGRVQVTIRDDGAGGATVCQGGGLRGLQDRVEALGGVFQLHCTPSSLHPAEHGTTLTALIPFGSGSHP